MKPSFSHFLQLVFSYAGNLLESLVTICKMDHVLIVARAPNAFGIEASDRWIRYQIDQKDQISNPVDSL